MERTTIKLIEKIIKIFNETKDLCSKLYKKLENSKTKSECDELIHLYKEIINNLKNIKEQSRALDNVDIEEDYLGTEDEVNQLRENNCKSIQCLAQHLRGCIQSFKKYTEMMKNKKEEIKE